MYLFNFFGARRSDCCSLFMNGTLKLNILNILSRRSLFPLVKHRQTWQLGNFLRNLPFYTGHKIPLSPCVNLLIQLNCSRVESLERRLGRTQETGDEVCWEEFCEGGRESEGGLCEGKGVEADEIGEDTGDGGEEGNWKQE